MHSVQSTLYPGMARSAIAMLQGPRSAGQECFTDHCVLVKEAWSQSDPPDKLINSLAQPCCRTSRRPSALNTDTLEGPTSL